MDIVEQLSDAEKELMSEIQDMPHAELVSEYMDLHAAFLAAEEEVDRLQKVMEGAKINLEQALELGLKC